MKKFKSHYYSFKLEKHFFTINLIPDKQNLNTCVKLVFIHISEIKFSLILYFEENIFIEFNKMILNKYKMRFLWILLCLNVCAKIVSGKIL